MVFYDTAYGKIAFNLDYSNLLVRLSGGFDSAVMLYALATALKEHNVSATIYPITVRKVGNPTKDAGNDKANPYPVVDIILNYVKKDFPDLIIENPQRLDINKWWKGNPGKKYSGAQDELILKVINDFNLGKDFAIYNGVTMNPNITIGEEKVNPEMHRQVIIAAGKIEGTLSVQLLSQKFNCEMEPFRNFDKRAVFSLADRLGILEDMLSITRSCEGFRRATDNFTTTCKTKPICWWCYEREWANENYER